MARTKKNPTNLDLFGFTSLLAEAQDSTPAQINRSAKDGIQLANKLNEPETIPFDVIELQNWLDQEGIIYLYDIMLDVPLIMKQGWTRPLPMSTKLDTRYVINPISRYYKERGQKVPSPPTIRTNLDTIKDDCRGWTQLQPFIEKWEANPTDRTDVIDWFLNIFHFKYEGERLGLFTGLCQTLYAALRLPLEPDEDITDPTKSAKKYPPLDLMVCIYGDGGMGKSSILQFLTSFIPDQAYLKELGSGFDPTNKDSRVEASKGWIVEANEFERIMKRGQEADYKAWLSITIDRNREAYHSGWTVRPRCIVVWGTTNKLLTMIDTDTNRRFCILVPDCSMNPKGKLWPDLTPDPAYYRSLIEQNRENEIADAVYDTEKAEELWHQIYWYLKRNPGAWRASSELIAFNEEHNRNFIDADSRWQTIQGIYETDFRDANNEVYLTFERQGKKQAWEDFCDVRMVLDDKNLLNIKQKDFNTFIDAATKGLPGLKIKCINHGNKLHLNMPYFSNKIRVRHKEHPALTKLLSMQDPTKTSLNVMMAIQERNDDLDYSSSDYENEEGNDYEND